MTKILFEQRNEHSTEKKQCMDTVSHWKLSV